MNELNGLVTSYKPNIAKRDDLGVVFYIINRLSFVLFKKHDLFMNQLMSSKYLNLVQY